MSLNPEQLGLVNRAKNAVNPFGIGECFNAALAAQKRDFWNIVLCHFVLSLVLGLTAIFTLIPFVGFIPFALLAPPLFVGFVRFNSKCLRGQPASLDDCFSGFDVFGSSVLTYILMVLCVAAGLILCVLPGLYLTVAYVVAWNLLAERKGTVWECLEMSRQAVTAHWGWALLLMFVAVILAYVGLIACIIGIVVTAPIYGLMLAAAYERLFPSQPTA